MEWNILYPNRKTCDMMCMPSKVMSYVVTIPTHMLKLDPINLISKSLGLPNQQAKGSKGR